MKRNHPELFEKAKAYEKGVGDDSSHDAAKNGFTWSTKYSLEEIIERAEKAEEKRMQEDGIIATDKSREARWQEIIAQELDEEGDEEACNICRL